MTQDLVHQLAAAKERLEQQAVAAEPLAQMIAAWVAYGAALLAELQQWRETANEVQAGAAGIIEQLSEIAGRN